MNGSRLPVVTRANGPLDTSRVGPIFRPLESLPLDVSSGEGLRGQRQIGKLIGDELSTHKTRLCKRKQYRKSPETSTTKGLRSGGKPFLGRHLHRTTTITSNHSGPPIEQGRTRSVRTGREDAASELGNKNESSETWTCSRAKKTFRTENGEKWGKVPTNVERSSALLRKRRPAGLPNRAKKASARIFAHVGTAPLVAPYPPVTRGSLSGKGGALATPPVRR